MMMAGVSIGDYSFANQRHCRKSLDQRKRVDRMASWATPSPFAMKEVV